MTRLFAPLPVAVVLALVYLPFGRAVPQPDLDPSWQLGMSLVHLHGFEAGPDWVFTYGPFGFLAVPDMVWLPGAVLGLLYAVVTAVGLYFLVGRCLRAWLAPAPAILVTTVFALICSRAAKPPELAATALSVWALTLVAPSELRKRLPTAIVVLLASASALQLLVKFTAGTAAVAVSVIVVVARPGRTRNALVWLGSFVAALSIVWVLIGQSLTNIARWLELSLEITLGYTDAMAIVPGWSGDEHWLFLAVLLVSVAGGLVFVARTARSRALPTVAVTAVTAWIFVKAGFVRLDPSHTSLTIVALCGIVMTVPWTRSASRVGVLCVVGALCATVLGLPDYPTAVRGELSAYAQEPFRGVRQGAAIARAVVQPSRRDSHLAVAREEIQHFYRVPDRVVQAIRGRDVLADPWDISAVWGYGLRWQPVPTMQTYSGYTKELDDLNAEVLTSPSGPTAILRNPKAIDARVVAWESPAYMLEMTCRYGVAVEARGWQALLRHPSACGQPQRLSERVLRPGQEIEVPSATNPDDLVVATFEMVEPISDRVLAALLKPTRFTAVSVNGEPRRFVVGTTSQPHLLKVPTTIDGQPAVNAGLDVRTLAIGHNQPSMTVTFWQIPLR